MMVKKGLVICLVSMLTACTITPKPLTVSDRYTEAKNDLDKLFSQQEPVVGHLNFEQALARGLKYNLDYRIKLVNNALQAGQLKIAMFTMFPALNLSSSVYSRNNQYSSSSVTNTGVVTDISSSTPNTVRSDRIGLTWNVLDFGLGYMRAKQQGEKIYIAEEESRKQLEQLSQEILVAYWDAYSAQQLMVEINQFEKILSKAKITLTQEMQDKALPKESILNYQSALLEGNRRVIQLKYKYDKAMLDLKHLLNLRPDYDFKLDPPPLALRKAHDLHDLDFRKLDAITLAERPELRGQHYQERIAEHGVKVAILQALPGISLNAGWNYNSNTYLLNNKWVDRELDVAWNLLNLASLPTAYDSAKTQVQYEKLKLMALTLTVLTETRYAFSHYENLRYEYEVAHKQTENANALFELAKNRNLASLESGQQVIIAKLRTLTAKMDEDLLLADMSTALGELYISAGSDVLPTNINDKSVHEIAQIISQNFVQQDTWDFKKYVNYTYDKLFADRSVYTLQLLGSYDVNKVKQVQKQLKNVQPTHAAVTKNNGRDWYVLTYGNYANAADAKSNLAHLPTELQSFSPWTRKTEGLTWTG